MTKIFGQPVIVETRPRERQHPHRRRCEERPDGYTLLMGATAARAQRRPVSEAALPIRRATSSDLARRDAAQPARVNPKVPVKTLAS